MDLYESQAKIVKLLEQQNELLEYISAALLASAKQEEDMIKKLLGEEKPDPISQSYAAMERMRGLG